jgi:hypothetical protein
VRRSIRPVGDHRRTGAAKVATVVCATSGLGATLDTAHRETMATAGNRRCEGDEGRSAVTNGGFAAQSNPSSPEGWAIQPRQVSAVGRGASLEDPRLLGDGLAEPPRIARGACRLGLDQPGDRPCTMECGLQTALE